MRGNNVETRYENVSTDTKEKRKCKWSRDEMFWPRDEMFWPIEKRICKRERAWIRVRGHSVFLENSSTNPFPSLHLLIPF